MLSVAPPSLDFTRASTICSFFAVFGKLYGLSFELFHFLSAVGIPENVLLQALYSLGFNL